MIFLAEIDDLTVTGFDPIIVRSGRCRPLSDETPESPLRVSKLRRFG